MTSRTVAAPAEGLGPMLRDSQETAALALACMARPDKLRAEQAPTLAAEHAIDVQRSCPRCGARHFDQRPYRPADAE